MPTRQNLSGCSETKTDYEEPQLSQFAKNNRGTELLMGQDELISKSDNTNIYENSEINDE